MTFEASDRNSFKVQGGRVRATHVAFNLLCKVELQCFLQVFATVSFLDPDSHPKHTHTKVGSPGQVVGLVVAKLLSTTCVVQGMMGTSLLHGKINQNMALMSCYDDV